MRGRELSKKDRFNYLKFLSLLVVMMLFVSFITTASFTSNFRKDNLLNVDGAIQHDYTATGHSEMINGAILENINPGDPSGTGVFNTFLRISSNNPIIQGYNSDGTNSQVEFDEDFAWTSSLLLNEVPTITRDPDGDGPQGTGLYREFQLDINQQNQNPYLCLDELEIYYTNYGPNIWSHGYDGIDFNGYATKIWELDAEENHTLILNYALNAGSGKRDFRALIPESVFPDDCSYLDSFCDTYVVLYCKFGGDNTSCGNNDGFEEWGVSVYDTASINGMKFFDENANGIKDIDEPGLENWKIYVDYNNNSIHDFGEPYNFTDVNGFYTIIGIVEGNYAIREELQPGWIQTYPTNGFYYEMFSWDDIYSGYDFGNYQSEGILIEKNVWDENSNEWVDSINSNINKNLSFMLNITNVGTQILTNIDVTDTLPSFLLYNYDATGNPTEEQDHLIEWEISSLNPQEYMIFYYSAQCIEVGTGNNYVTVINDQNTSSEDEVNITVDEEPVYNISILKKVWNESNAEWQDTISDYVGTNLTFKINITNLGNTDLTNLVIEDLLPGFLIYNYDSTGSPIVEQDHYITWQIASIAPQQSIIFTYSAYLAIQGAGYNIVNVTSDEDVFDEDSVLIYSNQVPNPDVILAKYVINESSGQLEEEIQGFIGDNLTFYITIYNMGNIDLTNLIIEDTLPIFLLYNYDATGSPTVEMDHYIEWHISSLSPGDYQTFTYTAQLTGVGDDFNIASVTTNEGVTSEDFVNITSNEVPVYLIKIDKQVFNSTSGQYQNNIQAYTSSNLTFRLSITNIGNEDLTNLVIQDTLPSFLLYNYDATVNTTVEMDHYIEWHISILSTSESFDIFYSAQLTDVGDADNYVNINTDQGAYSEDYAHVTSSIPPVYDFQIEKTVWNNKSSQWVKKISVLIDTIITFKITVSNNGTGTLTNLVITDTLSNELQYILGSANLLPSSYTDHSITWIIGLLTPGSSITIEYEALAIGVGEDASNYISCVSTETQARDDIAYVDIHTIDNGGTGGGSDCDCQTPIIQMITPDDVTTLYDMVTIQWYAINSDYQQRNEDIPIFLYISGNNGKTWSRIGTVHTNNIDIEHGSYEWDTRTVSDGKYIIMGETWNTCGYIAYDTTKPFYVDNQNRGIQVSFTEIEDITIDNKEYIKSKDTAKITATITGTLVDQLTCENITADLRFFGDSIRKADSFDSFEATWIVKDVSLKNNHGPITITILIDGEIKASCVIYADDINPVLSIAEPNGGIYAFNQKIFPLPLFKSIILGQLVIDLDMHDNYGIQKTEYYMNGLYLETIKKEPFTYLLDLKSIGQEVRFEVIAYDYAGNMVKDSRQLVLYNLYGELW